MNLDIAIEVEQNEDEILANDEPLEPIDVDFITDMTNDDPFNEDNIDVDVADGQTLYLLNALRKWVAEFNIGVLALRALLKIIKSAYKDDILPLDPRTVMKTPRNIPTTKLNDGAEYWHQGLDKCLRNKYKDLAEDTNISINVNIDGLPLFNSATKCFWPILANVHDRPDIGPMAIGIFYGEKKPENAEVYFRPFVNECRQVLEDGIIINGKTLTVEIRCFICDSPARAFIKG